VQDSSAGADARSRSRRGRSPPVGVSGPRTAHQALVAVSTGSTQRLRWSGDFPSCSTSQFHYLVRQRWRLGGTFNEHVGSRCALASGAAIRRKSTSAFGRGQDAYSVPWLWFGRSESRLQCTTRIFKGHGGRQTWKSLVGQGMLLSLRTRRQGGQGCAGPHLSEPLLAAAEAKPKSCVEPAVCGTVPQPPDSIECFGGQVCLGSQKLPSQWGHPRPRLVAELHQPPALTYVNVDGESPSRSEQRAILGAYRRGTGTAKRMERVIQSAGHSRLGIRAGIKDSGCARTRLTTGPSECANGDVNVVQRQQRCHAAQVVPGSFEKSGTNESGQNGVDGRGAGAPSSIEVIQVSGRSLATRGRDLVEFRNIEVLLDQRSDNERVGDKASRRPLARVTVRPRAWIHVFRMTPPCPKVRPTGSTTAARRTRVVSCQDGTWHAEGWSSACLARLAQRPASSRGFADTYADDAAVAAVAHRHHRSRDLRNERLLGQASGTLDLERLRLVAHGE